MDKKLTVSVLVWLQDATVAAEATSVCVGGAGSSGGGGSGGGGSGGGLGGSGGSGSGGRSADIRGPSSPANSLSPSPSPSTAGSPGGTSNAAAGNNVSAIVYPCIYCTATFPSQNKQTRHILAHSLETLKFREIMNSGHIANLLPPPLPSTRSQQQHQQQQQQINAAALMAAAAAAVTSSRSYHHLHQQPHPHHQSQTQPHHHSPSASLMCPPGLESPIEGKGLAELAAAGHVSPLDLEFAAAAAMGPNLMGSGSLSSLHRSSSPRSSSPGNNSMIMGRGHDGDGAGSSGGGSGGGLAGSGSNSVVMCKFCGKSFPDVSTLITHLPVHTGDRPFKCEYCGKAFKLRHHMKDHCRVHTGEERRKDLIIVVSFMLLTKHVCFFAGERPFRCGLCGKTFSRSTILKAHEKTHYPKFVRKFLSPSPVDTRDDSSPQ